MSDFFGEDIVCDEDTRTSVEQNIKGWEPEKVEYLEQCCKKLGLTFSTYESRGVLVANIGCYNKDLSDLWKMFEKKYPVDGSHPSE